MIRKIVNTKPEIYLTILRLSLGMVIFAHGAQKMLGLFGGYGFTGTIHAFSQYMNFSAPVTVSVIFVEFFGSIMLLTGLLTRVAALGIFGLFIGILLHTAGNNSGFFMNWEGIAKPEGLEYFFLVLGMALALLAGGGGSFSLDSKISSSNNNN
jgi:putative oxidoreductase